MPFGVAMENRVKALSACEENNVIALFIPD
jgi:hypothetical protein